MTVSGTLFTVRTKWSKWLSSIGHAMHEFAQADLHYTSMLDLPMEAAELASMSMEMLSMPHWNVCYTDKDDFRKARYDQIEDALRFFPWCMVVDAFQQEIYTKADTAELREKAFLDVMDRFSAGVDWDGLKDEKTAQWLFQLHIFEVPFYYIEYGIAQLGALAMYRQYKKHPVQAVENYKKFLHLGHQVPLSDLYAEAGIELKFTQTLIRNTLWGESFVCSPVCDSRAGLIRPCGRSLVPSLTVATPSVRFGGRPGRELKKRTNITITAP